MYHRKEAEGKVDKTNVLVESIIVYGAEYGVRRNTKRYREYSKNIFNGNETGGNNTESIARS